MAAAGKPKEEEAGGPDLRRRAAQLEDELPYAVGGDRDRKRRECANAYLSCARGLLGGAAAESGAEADEKDALECLEKAAGINGLWHACADVCAQRAKVRQKSGRYAEACAWLGHALSLQGRAGDSEGQKARKKMQALRDRCIECWEELVKEPVDDMDGPYRTALLADPSRSQTHLDMGYVIAGRGDADRAAECYEAACGADPGSAEARFRAGTALEEIGQYVRAARRYAESAGIDPGLSRKAAMGCAQCGRSLAAMGRHADAAAALESAAVLDPAHDLECARAHERCAGAARDGDATDAQCEAPPQGGAGIGTDGHYARAAEMYQKGAGEDADAAAAGCARCGRALGKRGRLEEAATALEAAAGIDPSHALECADACEKFGAAALRAGGTDAAADHYQRAGKWYSGPAGGGGGTIGDARGCLRCGRALGQMGMPEEAAACIEAAAELDRAHAPECARAHEECGAALRSGPGGRDDEAAAHYAKAASWHQEASAGDAGAAAEAAAGCARCGRALADMGRLAEAAEALGAAAKLEPSHAPECAEAHERCAAEARSRRGGDAGEAARHYAEAARWHRAAAGGGGSEKAAAGCARCGRALGEMGRLEAAAEAHAGAAALDPSLALEQARACMDMADRAGAGKGRGVRARILRLALKCCGGAGGGEKSPGLRLAAADILLDMGRHEEAAAEYGRAFGEDRSLRPRCGGGCVRCGDGLAGDSRISEAVACVRGAQAAGMIGPEECEDALARWGRAMFAESRHGEAAACFKAGAEAGGSAASWLGLAASLSGDGRHAEAAAAYGEAPGEEHGGPGPRRFAAEASGSAGGSAACLAIADALLGEGMHGEAEGWYARARKGGTGAERSRAYVGIARSLHAESMHAPAYDSLLMAAAAAADGAGTGTGRLCAGVGAGLEGEGLHGRAAECYEMAAEMDAGIAAECAEGCLRAGGALEKAGRRKDAIACYEAASRIDAGSHAAHFAIADAAARDGNYNRAEWYYEVAGKCGGNAERAGAGMAMCRASDLYKRARDEVDMPTKRRLYVEAEDAYAEAARRSPEGPEPLIGAGKACLKQRSDVDNLRRAEEYFAGAIALDPRLLEAHLLAGKAARKHAQGTGDRSRYADAMRYYDAAIEGQPDRVIAAKYWRGVCMLCGGEDGDEAAKEFLSSVLDGAEPADSEERHYCGKICDILGRYGEAAEYYLGSLEGSRLYSAGFYSRIDRGRIRSGRAAGGGAAVGGPRGAGTGGEAGGAPDLQYVCDTNVVISYLDHLARGTVFEGSMVPMFEKRQCFIPQVCYNEAYGKVAGSEQRSRMLHDAIGPLCTVIKGRGRMDMRMQRAREAFMSAWLYSGEDTIREWCMHADDKAAKKSARYVGGPPSGRDVLVLATAIDMHVNPARPASTSLVTWDSDFTAFGDHIRAETGVEVVRPEDVGR